MVSMAAPYMIFDNGGGGGGVDIFYDIWHTYMSGQVDVSREKMVPVCYPFELLPLNELYRG